MERTDLPCTLKHNRKLDFLFISVQYDTYKANYYPYTNPPYVL